jgi:hypothetical protein
VVGAGGLRNLGHAFGAGDVAECRLEQIGVAVLKNGMNMGGDVLFGFQGIDGMPPPLL